MSTRTSYDRKAKKKQKKTNNNNQIISKEEEIGFLAYTVFHIPDLFKVILNFTKNNGFNWNNWIDGNSAIRNGHITLLKEKWNDLIFTIKEAWEAAIKLGNIEVLEMLQNNPDLKITLITWELNFACINKKFEVIKWLLNNIDYGSNSKITPICDNTNETRNINELFINNGLINLLYLAEQSIIACDMINLKWLKEKGFKFDVLLKYILDDMKDVVSIRKENINLHEANTFIMREISSNNITHPLLSKIIQCAIKKLNIKLIEFIVLEIFHNKIPTEYVNIIINKFNHEVACNIIDRLEYLGFKVTITNAGIKSVYSYAPQLIKNLNKRGLLLINEQTFINYINENTESEELNWVFDNIKITSYESYSHAIESAISSVSARYNDVECYAGFDALRWFFDNNNRLFIGRGFTNEQILNGNLIVSKLLSKERSLFFYNYHIQITKKNEDYKPIDNFIFVGNNELVGAIWLDKLVEKYGMYKNDTKELNNLTEIVLIRGNIEELNWFESKLPLLYNNDNEYRITCAIESKNINIMNFIKDKFGYSFKYNRGHLIQAINNNDICIIDWLLCDTISNEFKINIFTEFKEKYLMHDIIINLNMLKIFMDYAMTLTLKHIINKKQFYEQLIVYVLIAIKLHLFGSFKFIIQFEFDNSPKDHIDDVTTTASNIDLFIQEILCKLIKKKRFNWFSWIIYFYKNKLQYNSNIPLPLLKYTKFLDEGIIGLIYIEGYIPIIKIIIKEKIIKIMDLLSHIVNYFSLVSKFGCINKKIYYYLFDELELHKYTGYCKQYNKQKGIINYDKDNKGNDKLITKWIDVFENLFTRVCGFYFEKKTEKLVEYFKIKNEEFYVSKNSKALVEYFNKKQYSIQEGIKLHDTKI